MTRLILTFLLLFAGCSAQHASTFICNTAVGVAKVTIPSPNARVIGDYIRVQQGDSQYLFSKSVCVEVRE